MEIRLLQTFIAVANLGSFTQAAEQMNYAQSSVTAQIQALEAELGVRLFERLGKSTTLTEEGKTLLVYARRILSLCEEARQSVSPAQAPGGTLVIGAPESLFAVRLAPLLTEYHKLYPAVEISLRFGACNDFFSQLRDGSLDFAFFLGTLHSSAPYVSLMEWPEPMALLAAPGSPLALRGEPLQPADLAGMVLILTEPGCTYRESLLRELAESGITPASMLDSSSVQVMKQLAAGGFGVTYLPKVAAMDEMLDGRLVELPFANHSADLAKQVVRVVRHKDKWVSPAMRAFIDLAEKSIVLQEGQPADCL